jgi:hypothetical protein
VEDRIPINIDINAEAAKLTMFRGRTPQTTFAERKGSAVPYGPCRLSRRQRTFSCHGTRTTDIRSFRLVSLAVLQCWRTGSTPVLDSGNLSLGVHDDQLSEITKGHQEAILVDGGFAR